MTWIPDIKNWWRFWSVRLAFLGGIILVLFERAPEFLAVAWGHLPDAVTDTIPEVYLKYVALALIPASMIARAIKQKKLHEDEK
ncbi:MAG: hypothetical protein H5U29_10210 [Pusillimonas sp.]|nr:hypothetical protein [Pusillimonas sp.]